MREKKKIRKTKKKKGSKEGRSRRKKERKREREKERERERKKERKKERKEEEEKDKERKKEEDEEAVRGGEGARKEGKHMSCSPDKFDLPSEKAFESVKNLLGVPLVGVFRSGTSVGVGAVSASTSSKLISEPNKSDGKELKGRM